MVNRLVTNAASKVAPLVVCNLFKLINFETAFSQIVLCHQKGRRFTASYSTLVYCNTINFNLSARLHPAQKLELCMPPLSIPHNI